MLFSVGVQPFAEESARRAFVKSLHLELDEAALDASLQRLEVLGLLMSRPRNGWKLTKAGISHVQVWCTQMRNEIDQGSRGRLEVLYQRFLVANAQIKDVCTRWQLRKEGTEYVVNDHCDARWDESVRITFASTNMTLLQIVSDLERERTHYRMYAERLAAAAARFAGGDHTALLVPLTGSYHDVVMELHVDLLMMLGRDRTEADGY